MDSNRHVKGCPCNALLNDISIIKMSENDDDDDKDSMWTIHTQKDTTHTVQTGQQKGSESPRHKRYCQFQTAVVHVKEEC